MFCKFWGGLAACALLELSGEPVHKAREGRICKSSLLGTAPRVPSRGIMLGGLLGQSKPKNLTAATHFFQGTRHYAKCLSCIISAQPHTHPPPSQAVYSCLPNSEEKRDSEG